MNKFSLFQTQEIPRIITYLILYQDGLFMVTENDGQSIIEEMIIGEFHEMEEASRLTSLLNLARYVRHDTIFEGLIRELQIV